VRIVELDEQGNWTAVEDTQLRRTSHARGARALRLQRDLDSLIGDWQPELPADSAAGGDGGGSASAASAAPAFVSVKSDPDAARTTLYINLLSDDDEDDEDTDAAAQRGIVWERYRKLNC